MKELLKSIFFNLLIVFKLSIDLIILSYIFGNSNISIFLIITLPVVYVIYYMPIFKSVSDYLTESYKSGKLYYDTDHDKIIDQVVDYLFQNYNFVEIVLFIFFAPECSIMVLTYLIGSSHIKIRK